ncbi:MAG: hypothetical protein ABI053_03395 [Lacisediminihabitans sp.]
MNTFPRRIVLALTAAIGIVVGVWAAAFPHSFYTNFPGFGFIWVVADGPFNEHLIRDVGGLYLAIAAATVFAIFSREPAATRAVGIAWTVFGVLHFGYHASHLRGMTTANATGELVGLGTSLVLGVMLILPAHSRRTDPDAAHHHEETAQ